MVFWGSPGQHLLEHARYALDDRSIRLAKTRLLPGSTSILMVSAWMDFMPAVSGKGITQEPLGPYCCYIWDNLFTKESSLE